MPPVRAAFLRDVNSAANCGQKQAMRDFRIFAALD
jgi:hypothetical protein